MLTGPQQKFAEAFALGNNAKQAYLLAYPSTTERAAESHGSRMVRNGKVAAEIARIRAEASRSAVLTLVEKRNKLAGIVRAPEPILDGCEIRIADKIAAIKLDNDLAGEGSEAAGNDALAQLLERVMR